MEYSLKVASRWLRLRSNGTFKYRGKTRHIEEFKPEAYPTIWTDNDGKLHYLSGWSNDGLGIEFEDGMEWCRLHRENIGEDCYNIL